jgi:hypothetical protein
MNVLIKAIRVPEHMDEFEDSWNELVRFSSNNPFHLHEFTMQFLASDQNSAWRPLLLVAYSNNKIVGIAPLKETRKLGIRFVRFVASLEYSPDFVTNDEAKEQVIGKMLEYLFLNLGCHLVDLYLPFDPMNVIALKKGCELYGLHLSLGTQPSFGHRVLPITCDWNDFERRRGSNFRNKMRKIERKFARTGKVEVTCYKNPGEDTSILARILEVESVSWKEAWRKQRGERVDPDIQVICNASAVAARKESDFEWRVYFLELDKTAIAYSIVLRYKNTAFIAKITNNERYRRFYPGIYLINAILKEEFTLRKVSLVDFETDMEFMDTWTRICHSRFRALVSKDLLPFVIQSLLLNNSIARIIPMVFTKVTEELPSMGNLLTEFYK